ncbi:MAG TPA: type II toxin-antitoxin system PrlF family antitoxin [Longimicrobium sp.]|nr:type II toxin-antitoxin system PrlF family antitoxin [Longimicrobium sp.]
MSYTGKATTAGNSKALSFESALFKAHPEFGAGRFEAHVIAPGTLLVTSAEDAAVAPEAEDDPVLLAYLAFLERQMGTHPELIQPLDMDLLARMDALLGDIEVDLTEDLGPDAHLP